MRDFRRAIESEAERIDRLHQLVHDTYKARNKDISAWKEACSAFNSYASVLDPLIEEVYESTQLNSDELVEFAIVFLEVNPMFFRSGYIKEEILRKIKRSELSEKQMERLRTVLIEAVNDRGTREFRGYCRLLPRVSNPKLIATLENTARHGEGARRSRAAVMLSYINENST